MHTQFLIGILTATTLASTAMTDGASAPTDVVAVHGELLEALDRADAAAVAAMLSPLAVLYVQDKLGQPVTLQGAHAAESFVALWGRDIEDSVPAALLDGWVVGKSDAGTTFVFEFERPSCERPYFRATSTLIPVRDGEDNEVQILHLHISPSDRQDLASPNPKQSANPK